MSSKTDEQTNNQQIWPWEAKSQHIRKGTIKDVRIKIFLMNILQNTVNEN